MEESLENRKGRLLWLDFGKAAGILVVLAVHAGCSLGPVTFYGGMVYMPIFFVAAGYTYRRREGEAYGDFLKGKAQRLLRPYFGISAFLWAFFWLKDSVLGGHPLDIKPLSVFGILYSRNQAYLSGHVGQNPGLLTLLNAPLWFLTAIFLVYAYYGLLGRSGRKTALLAAGLSCSVLWHHTTELLLPWSLEAVPYFACFFAAGEWMRRKDAVGLLARKGKLWMTALLLAAFLLLSRWNGSVNVSCGEYGRSMLLYLAIGSIGSLLVLVLGKGLEAVCWPIVRLLAVVGQETLGILCLHMFLFMFLRAGAGLAGLGEGWIQALLVVGSTAVLTLAGRIGRALRAPRRGG